MELDYDYIAKLVRKTQEGDSDAFAELYTATYQSQYRFAYQYVKDPYLAQDILQEVYILVLKNLDTLKNPRLFVSWLHQITFRICFDTWQKRKRQEQELDYISSGQTSDFSESFSDIMTNPEKHILNKDAKARLMQAIQSLPPQYSQAIIMRYYNNMSIEDIAVAWITAGVLSNDVCAKGANVWKTCSTKKKEGFVLNKDYTSELDLHASSFDNTDIPALDSKTANQLLNNVFNASDMEPSTIPVEVLEDWGNYKKTTFGFGRTLAYLCTLLLILMPLLFIKPTIIAERTKVDSAQSAVYNIRVKTLLPIREVTADLDGHPIALTKKDTHTYTAEVTSNGTLTIHAEGMNAQTSLRSYKVSSLDTEKPKLLDSYSRHGVVYLDVSDTYSGINYDAISGLVPKSINKKTGTISFMIPKQPTTIKIPDNAGNELELLLSPVKK